MPLPSQSDFGSCSKFRRRGKDASSSRGATQCTKVCFRLKRIYRTPENKSDTDSPRKQRNTGVQSTREEESPRRRVQVSRETRFLVGLVARVVSSAALQLLSLVTSRSGSGVVRALVGQRNVSLGRRADQEGGDGDELTSHANVTLTNHNASHVNGARESLLRDDGLKTSVQEFLSGKIKDKVKSLLLLIEESVLDETVEQRLTLEDALRVSLRQGQELTRGLSELGKRQLRAPDLSLTAKTILSAQTKLGIKTLLLERTSRRLERLSHCRKRKR